MPTSWGGMAAYGPWVHYWTQTAPHPVHKQPASQESSNITTQKPKEMFLDNDNALLMNGIISDVTVPEGAIGDELHQSSNPSMYSPSSPQPTLQMTLPIKQAGKSRVKEKNKQEKTYGHRHAKHFIIQLPKGLGHILDGVDKWEQAPIGGAEDEVKAHTGLFKPGRNFDYERLVDRVKAT